MPSILRECRQRVRLSQSAFARRLGVSIETYRPWDSGRRQPPQQIIDRAKQFAAGPGDVALFGQKDAQQVAVVKQVVRDLNVPIEIRVLPIVRDSDGLALSSRHSRLSVEERARALAIPIALVAVLARIGEGKIQSRLLVRFSPSVEGSTSSTSPPRILTDGPHLRLLCASAPNGLSTMPHWNRSECRRRSITTSGRSLSDCSADDPRCGCNRSNRLSGLTSRKLANKLATEVQRRINLLSLVGKPSKGKPTICVGESVDGMAVDSIARSA
jgi:transcriptional regulator with XRE-family HTH domain